MLGEGVSEWERVDVKENPHVVGVGVGRKGDSQW
jgi:hypothetical protein